MTKDNDPTGRITEAKESSGRLPLRPLQLESGEVLIYSTPGVDARRRPAVTLGRLKRGEMVLHFRVYARNGRGRYAITHVGASFKPHELAEITAKVNELADVLPELALALGGPQ